MTTKIEEYDIEITCSPKIVTYYAESEEDAKLMFLEDNSAFDENYIDSIKKELEKCDVTHSLGFKKENYKLIIHSVLFDLKEEIAYYKNAIKTPRNTFSTDEKKEIEELKLYINKNLRKLIKIHRSIKKYNYSSFLLIGNDYKKISLSKVYYLIKLNNIIQPEHQIRIIEEELRKEFRKLIRYNKIPKNASFLVYEGIIVIPSPSFCNMFISLIQDNKLTSNQLSHKCKKLSSKKNTKKYSAIKSGVFPKYKTTTKNTYFSYRKI